MGYLASNEAWADWEAMDGDDKALILAAVRVQAQLRAVQEWDQAKERERKAKAARAKELARGRGRR